MAEMKQVIAPDSPAAVRLALLGGFNADLGDCIGSLLAVALYRAERYARSSRIASHCTFSLRRTMQKALTSTT